MIVDSQRALGVVSWKTKDGEGALVPIAENVFVLDDAVFTFVRKSPTPGEVRPRR